MIAAPRRLAIWDPSVLADPDGDIPLAALEPGRAFAWDAVQLRSIFAAGKTVVEQVADAVQAYGGLQLWINRDVAFAKQVRATGVHLGTDADERTLAVARDAGLAVGISVHDPDDARRAKALAADLAIFGHVRATPSKPGLEGRGFAAVTAAAAAADPVPLLAVGGLELIDEPEVHAAGAWGLAAIRAAWRG